MAQFFDRLCAPAVRRTPPWLKPNHITILRGVLVIPVVCWQHRPAIAVATLLLSSACDIFDGVLARVRGETSEQGASLDAWMDKLFILGALWLACWPTALEIKLLVTGLELLLVSIRFEKTRRRVTSRSNRWGGLKTWAQSFAIAFVLTRSDLLVRWSLLPFLLGIIFAAGSIIGHLRDIADNET